MDIKQLKYFVGVAEAGSFSAAAKVLFVSQPALSKSMKSLEEKLGVQLFHLSGKRMQVTEYGEQLYAISKSLIEQHESIYQTIHCITGLQKGKVRVGIPPIIGTCVFPQLIAGFMEQYPGIEIDIDQHGASHVQHMLDKEQLDVAFTILPIISEAFEVYPIVQDKNVLLVSPQNPLAQHKCLGYSDLRNEKFVLLDQETMLYNNILAGCREANYVPRIVVKASQWDFVIQLVKLGMGISILPRPILNMYPDPDIALVDIAHPSAIWNVAMLTRKGSYQSLAVKTFVEYICQNHPGLAPLTA